ncbi:methyltransferase-like protein 23 [Melanaphis sacchari]|uniref:Methyltransferase-like protein 23 n=1 Tax=Melanaphis sacchari TaxID=742174 RepID=A0A2H8TDI8_9HEMI|nr:methyltransferase-like protein 23 [Melanaphis sacchari]
MNSDLPPFCQPGPSTSKDENHLQTNADEKLQFPPYHFQLDSAQPSTSSAQLTYPMPLSPWPNSQSFPSYMPLAVNPTQSFYPSTSSLRLPPAEQVPPNCLDWTINPIKPPPQQFKTTSDPLFALGYNSTISENWMEGDKGLQYSIKNFTFCTKRINNSKATTSSNQVNEYDSLLVSIPQALEGDYHYYVWPASPVLAWIIWEHRLELPGKKILEVGSGTSLPGIVAAKCGAIVTLTDDPTIPGTLKHVQKCCYMNGLYPEQIRVLGLQWGYFFRETLNIGPFDLIIGSDCFYEPTMFEDLIATISFLLERNPLAKFMTTYHERDPEYGIDELAAKWKLNCTHKSLEDLGQNNELDIYELMKGNDIHLIEITKKVFKKNET